MSDSNSTIQPYADAWTGFLKQVNGIVDTAMDDDAKGNWGADAWIRLIHNLIDAQIRTYGLVVQTALGGPAALKAVAVSEQPRPSAPFQVPKVNYSRTIHASGFVRQGQPGTELKSDCIRFYPASLTPDDTQFRVGLTDYSYVGAHYTGSIELYRADAAPGDPPDWTHEVTVGL
jgi:hypothetical protein